MAEAWVAVESFAQGFSDFGMNGRGVPVGGFSGSNAVVTRDGGLVPRNGLALLPFSAPAGVLHGFGTVPALTNNIWFIIGSTVYRSSIGGGSVDTVGTLGATPAGYSEMVSSVRDTYTVYFTVDGVGSWALSPIPATPTLTQLTGAPGGQAITKAGGFLIVADGNQLKWSAENNFNSWPVTSVYSVGRSDITALLLVRDTLFVFKETEGIYVVSNVTGDPANWVLRLASTAVTALVHSHVAEFQGTMITSRWNTGNGAPAVLDGAQPKLLRQLAGQIQAPYLDNFDVGIVSDPHDGTTMLLDGTAATALVYRSPDCWTKQVFSGTAALQGFMEMSSQESVLLATKGGGGLGPAFYLWQCDHSENAGEGSGVMDTPSDPGSTTGVIADVYLPEFSDPEDRDFQVRKVVFDVVSYPTGASDANMVEVTASCASYAGQTANTLPGATATWTETVTPAAGGSRRQVVLTFGVQQDGPAWQLRVRLRGVRLLVPVRILTEVSGSRAR